MIDTDDVKKFQELAIEHGKLEKDQRLYGVVRRLQKQYGTETVLDGLNFLTEKILQGKMYGYAVPGLVAFCGKASKYIAIGEQTYEPTNITWAQDLDLTGIEAAIYAFSTRSGKAINICAKWSDKDIEREILFLKMIKQEWDAIKKINKTRIESRKRRIWQEYKKSIRNLPTLLLQSQHEMRILEFKENGQ
mgnify:CR=1 FL=1|jgi:hypothetical protein|tara:strand:- start:644 stop:1216 length:573 start_codon:yes stop_codon:yes gene_type:complete